MEERGRGRGEEERARIADIEAVNTLRQFDRVIELIEQSIASKQPPRFDSELLKELHAIALDGIATDAGRYRTGRVFITNSEHQPPTAADVPGLVDEMCRHVHNRWPLDDATYLAAYVMWRLNWIHPFADGNGRTSRAAAYLVLSCRLGFVLRGSVTVPALFGTSRRNYYEVLADADAAWRGGRLNVDSLERLLRRFVVRQLNGPTL